MKVGSLCSGFGGLDLAVEGVFDGQVEWVADTDRDAASVLAARYPETPNVGDITICDWAGIEADLITAGYPCQPFSTAGHRKGTDDPRHLWPHALRAIRDIRPRHVILENVAGHLSLGFGRVLADLASIGFDAEWAVIRASEVGAPHHRARLFVVAHPHGTRRESIPVRPAMGRPLQPAGAAPHTHSVPTRWDLNPTPRPQSTDDGRPEIHSHRPTNGTGATGFERYQQAIDRWAVVIGRPPPTPPLLGKQVNARFVEWMMGLPAGWVTDLIPNRRALRVLGNGVVPQQAAHALRILNNRIR